MKCPSLFPSQTKIKTRKALEKMAARARALGKTVVFTNGCFDILHAGHVTYLEKAKRLGDILVVGVNSDHSVRKIKGPGRPVNSEGDRARVLAALEAVDYVTLFSEETPLALIRQIRPAVLVKGADWKESGIVGARDVKSWGGKVRRVRLVPGRSTTGLLKKLQA